VEHIGQPMEKHHINCHTRITHVLNGLEKIYKTKKDWFMDSEEALKLKVIDEIV
jgi:hypothetical protein